MKVCDRPIRGTNIPAIGTDAGFQRHWRAREEPCEPCRQAHTQHVASNQSNHPFAHNDANKRWRGSNPDYFHAWKREHPGYDSWKNMIHRCTDPKHIGYERWGGRGITVCDRWMSSYENFIQDMGEPPGLEYSIDRINNDWNYEPSNCRWATRKEQRANRRDSLSK